MAKEALAAAIGAAAGKDLTSRPMRASQDDDGESKDEPKGPAGRLEPLSAGPGGTLGQVEAMLNGWRDLK